MPVKDLEPQRFEANIRLSLMRPILAQDRSRTSMLLGFFESLGLSGLKIVPKASCSVGILRGISVVDCLMESLRFPL